jgi:hypothetical protein
MTCIILPTASSGNSIAFTGPNFFTSYNNNSVLVTTNSGILAYPCNCFIAGDSFFSMKKKKKKFDIIKKFFKAGYQDGPAGSARFSGPIGLDLDSTGNLYIADK